MNTGVQRSSATPPAARTATTPAVGPAPGNVFGQGKNVPLIAMAHDIPYVATATRGRSARPRGQGDAGPWASAARATSTSSCPARSAGARTRPTPSRWRGWPSNRACSRCSRPSTARSSAAPRSAARCRSRTTCSLQKRFAHLFGETCRTRRRIARIQAMADRNIERFGLLAEETLRWTSPSPSPSTSARASPTTPAPGARAAGLRRPPAAVQRTPAPPARTSRAGCTTPSRGDYEAAWRELIAEQPAARRHGPRLLSPLRNRRATAAQLDEAVGINSVERFLGDEAIKRGWTFEPPAQESGKRVLVVGAGPSGLSAAYHLRAARPPGDHPRGRSARRRHDALRHSQVPPAARCSRRRDCSASSTWASSSSSTARSTTILDDDAARARSTPPSSPSARTSPSAPTFPPARRRARSSTRSPCCAAWRASEKPLLGRRVVVYGGGNTAHRRRPHRQAAGRERFDHRLPAHAREDAGARLRGRGSAARKA